MTLKELKDHCDFYISRGHENDDVVITLSQPSVGPRAYTNVVSALSGFDWEDGQFRLEPEEKLLKKEKDRDVPDISNLVVFCKTAIRTGNL